MAACVAKARLLYDHIGAHMIHGIGKMIDEKTGKVCATCLISYAILDIDEPGLQV